MKTGFAFILLLTGASFIFAQASETPVRRQSLGAAISEIRRAYFERR